MDLTFISSEKSIFDVYALASFELSLLYMYRKEFNRLTKLKLNCKIIVNAINKNVH